MEQKDFIQKPPLGVMRRSFWLEFHDYNPSDKDIRERKRQLKQAIKRYEKAGIEPVLAWRQELKEYQPNISKSKIILLIAGIIILIGCYFAYWLVIFIHLLLIVAVIIAMLLVNIQYWFLVELFNVPNWGAFWNLITFRPYGKQRK